MRNGPQLQTKAIMTTENKKTFSCKALTQKGDFNVEIQVWEQVSDGALYFQTRTWKTECLIKIGSINMKGIFNRFDTTKIKSFEVGAFFKINREVSLMCDTSEIKKYIDQIAMNRCEKTANDEQEIQIIKNINNL